MSNLGTPLTDEVLDAVPSDQPHAIEFAARRNSEAEHLSHVGAEIGEAGRLVDPGREKSGVGLLCVFGDFFHQFP